MAKKKPSPPLMKVGDRVRIRYYPHLRARIVELRGPLGPGGAQVYDIRVQSEPKPYHVEVLEDQLEVIPPKGKATP